METRYQLLMMVVKMLAMDGVDFPLSSNKIEQFCESFKRTLLDDQKALALFRVASEIFEKSGLDLTKRQYKSESETELLVDAVMIFIKGIKAH